MHALPFAASASVAAFLRISMFLWYVGAIGLRLAWISFYHDFVMLSREDCARNTNWSAECLFDLLRELFARESKKATQFGVKFSSLGVVFDLQKIAEGTVFVGHTVSRRQELADSIKELLRGTRCSAKTIERPRERLL